MKEKVVLLIDQHPDILKWCTELDEMRERAKQEATFLQKQLKAIQDRAEKEKRPLWENIESYLKENNLIPDWFDENKHTINYSTESNAVRILEQEDNSIPIEIRKLFTGMIKLDD